MKNEFIKLLGISIYFAQKVSLLSETIMFFSTSHPSLCLFVFGQSVKMTNKTQKRKTKEFTQKQQKTETEAKKTLQLTNQTEEVGREA